jgi:hypothetical protein
MDAKRRSSEGHPTESKIKNLLKQSKILQDTTLTFTHSKLSNLIYQQRWHGFEITGGNPKICHIKVRQLVGRAEFEVNKANRYCIIHETHPVPSLFTPKFRPHFDGRVMGENGQEAFDYSRLPDGGIRVSSTKDHGVAEVTRYATEYKISTNSKCFYIVFNGVPVAHLKHMSAFKFLKFVGSGMMKFDYGVILKESIFCQSPWLVMVAALAELFIDPHRIENF